MRNCISNSHHLQITDIQVNVWVQTLREREWKWVTKRERGGRENKMHCGNNEAWRSPAGSAAVPPLATRCYSWLLPLLWLIAAFLCPSGCVLQRHAALLPLWLHLHRGRLRGEAPPLLALLSAVNILHCDDVDKGALILFFFLILIVEAVLRRIFNYEVSSSKSKFRE